MRRVEDWSAGWRGPALAGLVALAAGLPGLLAVPPLDRDESRFAQATAQMLESRDFVVIRFQEAPRFKKPVGIHWLQAASVSLLSDTEARAIWAYRLPSLLGATLAAAACAWGASAFFGGRTGMLAGGLLGASMLLSTEAMIAKTDAALAGCVTLCMAALARVYASERGGPACGRGAVMTFWGALAAAILIKGPVAPMVVALALLGLCALDRRPAWLTRLDWYWGLVIVAFVVGPWAGAVTVATDGAFWSQAFASDLAPKLAGGQESHGAWPGYHLLLAPLLAFPISLALPAAAVLAWSRRAEPGVRFALAWLVPAWLVFELAPTKLPHYPLPLYGALAWLAAAALDARPGAKARWAGAGLQALCGVALAGACIALFRLWGSLPDTGWAVACAGLLAAAGLISAGLLLRGRSLEAALAGVVLAALGHAVLAAGLLPRLHPLWLSSRAEQVLAQARLLPRQGVAEAPVAVAGYAEPSLVFALGTTTELDGPEGAAKAIAERRPAIVEARQDSAFHAALGRLAASARPVGEVRGLNYSKGDPATLRIYRAGPP